MLIDYPRMFSPTDDQDYRTDSDACFTLMPISRDVFFPVKRTTAISTTLEEVRERQEKKKTRNKF